MARGQDEGKIDRMDSWCPIHNGSMPCKKCASEAEVRMIEESAARAKKASQPPEVAPTRESFDAKPEIVRMKIAMMDSIRLGAFMHDLRKIGTRGNAAIEALRGAIVQMDSAQGSGTRTTERKSDIRDISHLPPAVRRLAEMQRSRAAQPAPKELGSQRPLSVEQEALYRAVLSLPADTRKEVMDRLDVFITKQRREKTG